MYHLHILIIIFSFSFFFFFFFFNDTATTEIYTLSLHDALPISLEQRFFAASVRSPPISAANCASNFSLVRSEEHTSELQSRPHLVCRLLLEKKKKKKNSQTIKVTYTYHIKILNY